MISIHELLTQTATQKPTKEALVSGPRRFTYEQIETSSNALAHYLRSRGVEPGDRVGIFSTKDFEEVVAIFAIAKIGAVMVHVNPSFREKQLAHVVQDCSVKALLLKDRDRIVAGAFPEGSSIELIVSMQQRSRFDLSGIAEVVPLASILESQPTTPPEPFERTAEDLAAIIYTSGSTGMPKGIMVTHQVFLDSTTVSAQVLRNHEGDRIISATPFSFDGALSQLFTAFLVGATLVLQRSNFANDIVKTLLEERITGMHAVPSLWNMLMNTSEGFASNSYPDLRYVTIIGEAFQPDRFEKLRSILQGTEFHMMYGTTEAFRSTCLLPHELATKPGSVGRGLPGVEILIVDEGRVCAPGEVGEIVHRGVFISPGYWNDPEKTARVFRNGDVYTGDLGRLDAEGYLYFAGRKDGMIKTNGFRVSPDEIEQCLYRIEGVKEAAVVPIKDEVFGYAIKAFLACGEGAGVDEGAVQAHCRKLLPHYMVPAQVEFRSELPKTGTGKINRSELKEI